MALDLRSYIGTPRHPFREALRAQCGGHEPPPWVGGYSSRELSDSQFQDLQEWVVNHVAPYWGTGIAAIEAADKIVDEAVGNGNIPMQKLIRALDSIGRVQEYEDKDGQPFPVEQVAEVPTDPPKELQF